MHTFEMITIPNKDLRSQIWKFINLSFSDYFTEHQIVTETNNSWLDQKRVKLTWDKLSSILSWPFLLS